MKIIKVNGSQEKVKYEIYNMQLNQEKARRYREELAKKVEFYRLEFKKDYDLYRNGGLGLEDYIEKVDKSKTKYIYEFTEIPKVEESIIYGDFGDTSLPDYHLHSYVERTYAPELYKEDREKGLAEQEEFINRFIEKGLLDYNYFGQLDNTDTNHMHAYIFLNSFGYGSKHSVYSYTDNVVSLPSEIMVMYLLEKGYIEEAHYYINKIVDLEEERKLFANFEFEKSSEFTQKQMRDLQNSDILDENVLRRRLSLDSYLTNYIK